MQVKDFSGGCFVGNDFSEGKLPALFYFSLSAEESLSLPPYNSPVTFLQNEALRIFSFTIPGHEEGLNKFDAMTYWASSGPSLIEDFIDRTSKTIEWLIETEVIDASRSALCGLSRGGFIASHLAAKLKKIPILLAFAPITQITELEEFRQRSEFEPLNLENQIDPLCFLKNIRFYIGNRDIRVGTEACFHFIRKMAEKKIKNLSVELFITQSIGREGHGTSPETFKEGSLWLKNLIFQ